MEIILKKGRIRNLNKEGCLEKHPNDNFYKVRHNHQYFSVFLCVPVSLWFKYFFVDLYDLCVLVVQKIKPLAAWNS